MTSRASDDHGSDGLERDEIGVAATLPDAVNSGNTPEPSHPLRRTVPDEVEPARVLADRFQHAAEPRKLGRYAVLGTLGQGGMGVVLRAYDRELDRQVALKVLRRELGEQHTTRLRREAQALAKLSHPNVVQVYEVGEIDGQTFVAMELVTGKTPREWLRQEPRPDWRACVRLFVQLGAGLAAAHERGLVHRDFKPANAIIDEQGRARVLDFGLARWSEDDAERELATPDRTPESGRVALEESLTTTGTVLGTPAYMPPEQMSGLDADARSDQFSFCVSLHEAVYGERPYEGDSMMGLMVAMRSGAVRPPPKGSEVPAALRKVLLRGLALDPAERWASMEVLIEQLRTIVAPRRARWIALGVAVGLLAIGGGLWADRVAAWANRCTGARAQLDGIWDDERRREVEDAILATELSYASDTQDRVAQQLDDYADAWVDEHTEVCEATAVRGEQSEEVQALRMGCLHERRLHLRATVDVLARADATVVEHAVQTVASLPSLSRCADVEALAADVPPPEDPAVAEQVAKLDEQLVAAKVEEQAGKYALGLALADAVVLEAKTLDYEPLLARAWLRQGTLRSASGDYEGAATALRQAYDAAVARSMPEAAAEASVRLVDVLGNKLIRLDEARSWAEHAYPLSRAAGTDEAEASYLASMGAMAQLERRLDDAYDFHERALAIREQALGPDHPAVARSLTNLGVAATGQAEHDEARRFYERALAIQEKALGPDHPAVARSLSNLSGAQRTPDEARKFLDRALAIEEKALGPDHPDLSVTLSNLSAVAEKQGKLDETREFQERALAIDEKAFGPDHPNVAVSLANLGVVVQAQGELEDARKLYARALAIDEKALGPDHPVVAALLRNLGTVAAAQGKLDEARDLLARAQAIDE
jgi:tetratricopeptide (TPR) repeat protein